MQTSDEKNEKFRRYDWLNDDSVFYLDGRIVRSITVIWNCDAFFFFMNQTRSWRWTASVMNRFSDEQLQQRAFIWRKFFDDAFFTYQLIDIRHVPIAIHLWKLCNRLLLTFVSWLKNPINFVCFSFLFLVAIDHVTLWEYHMRI